jgi:hypothetical protein
MRVLYKTSLLTESYPVLKSINSWCNASVYSLFFSSIWQIQNIWWVADLLYQIHISPLISSAYGVNFDSRMLDKILYVVDKCDLPLKLLVCFIALLVGKDNDRLPLLRQFLHIPNGMNKLMDLRANCSNPYFNQFCWDFINTWWLESFWLFNGQLKHQKHLDQPQVVLLYLCMPNSLNPTYIQ